MGLAVNNLSSTQIKQVVPASIVAATLSFSSPCFALDDALLAERLEALEQRVKLLEDELTLTHNIIRALTDITPGEVFSPPEADALLYSTRGISDTADVAAALSSAAQPQDRADTSNGFGQEMFVNRDTVPTLGTGRLEFAHEVTYGRNEHIITSERSVGIATTLRYGVSSRLELSARVPGFYARRSTLTSPTSAIDNHNFGVGDIELTASVLAFSPQRGHPGLTLSFGAIVPTGADPYFIPTGYTAGELPMDPTVGFNSHGHWGGKLNAQFFASSDPMVFFWGGGIEYLFDRTVQEYQISRGIRYSANAGISVAFSERTTIANSLQFSYEGSMRVNGTEVIGSSSENFVNRLALVQRVGESSFLEPTLTFGLTDTAQDVLVGLGYRVHW